MGRLKFEIFHIFSKANRRHHVSEKAVITSLIHAQVPASKKELREQWQKTQYNPCKKLVQQSNEKTGSTIFTGACLNNWWKNGEETNRGHSRLQFVDLLKNSQRLTKKLQEVFDDSEHTKRKLFDFSHKLRYFTTKTKKRRT